MHRHRIYREHKYMSFRISEFRRFVAKVDFSANKNIEEVVDKFKDIKELIHHHAEHENKLIHELLRKKHSAVHSLIEVDHTKHESVFRRLDQLLADALANTHDDIKIELGNRFHVEFQRFEGENLIHQFLEEDVIMPELQRLYTDEEILREVDGQVYAIMSVEDLIQMCQELFPHFNRDDREAFLRDIKTSQPNKFTVFWTGIKPSIDPNEHSYFISKLEENKSQQRT